VQVIKKYPDLLGIGLSESTAIVVKGDQFEVMGAWKVAIHDNTRQYQPWGEALLRSFSRRRLQYEVPEDRKAWQRNGGAAPTPTQIRGVATEEKPRVLNE
jgi:hypothetical protein